MSSQSTVLGNRIRDLRESKDLTQKELSSMIGLTPKMISFYENCQRTPPIDVLVKLAKIFNVTVDYLIGTPTSDSLYKNISIQELNLLQYYRGLSINAEQAEKKWGPITKYFSFSALLDNEEKELLEYYNELSLKDRRWIMGQMIDLIKKANEHDSDIPKAQ